MEKIREQQSRTETKARLVQQINIYLRSGDYSRAQGLMRGTGAEFPNDAELSELEKLALDGAKRNAEADRLITESQELFAQGKSAEAIQLLRKAYELNTKNSLARTILANALVEHAHSLVETDWLQAETLANQALKLNPAHPTAKTIRELVVEQKKKSTVDDWVAKARKLHSSGDLFLALAWVAEGLAVHPDDPKLQQVQDEIQRDQAARRRQTRRRDLEDLRRMEREIDGAADDPAKQALGERIQALAARYWTDGEILPIANGLLRRLGLVPENSATSPHGPGAPIIFYVPRPSPAKPPRTDASTIPESPVPLASVATIVASNFAPPNVAPVNIVLPNIVLPSIALPGQVVSPQSEPQIPAPPASAAPDDERSIAATQVTFLSSLPVSSPAPSLATQPKPSTRSKSTTLMLISAAAIILFAATLFFARKHHAPPVAETLAAVPVTSAPAVSAPVTATPTVSTPAVSAPAVSALISTPIASAPAQQTSEPSFPVSSGIPARKLPLDKQLPEESNKLGTLLIVANQNDAKVFLDGKLQSQLILGGQLRLTDLELKDYVVQISKGGFQDPPQQKIRLRKGEDARLIFNLQPLVNLQSQPRLASLTIQGGVPQTTVLVDQTPVGTIRSDGTFSLSTVHAGDHTIELRREGFKPRQFKKTFAEGGTVPFTASDVMLEAASGELKITFAPADATVAIAKGELLKIVSSGVPLNLAAGTYTLTARTAEKFTRSSTVEVIAGQSRTLDLSLAPSGMSKWDDPGAWQREGDSFTRKGGDFVLYGAAPASGTFVFSAMLVKGHVLQWVLNYSDPRNYVLFQMDDNNFHRTVIRNGQKTDEIIVPDKGDKKSFRTIQVRVGPTELIHQVKHGDRWTILDRWTQAAVDLSLGKFGLYLPGNDQVQLSGFSHYADLNIH